LGSTACCYSSPGKVILFGEHWVVHGGWALAAAIGLRAHACALEDLKAVSITVCSEELGLCEDLLHCNKMCGLAWGLKKLSAFCKPKYNVKVHIFSEIPVGAGLGSSAAVATAVLASLACIFSCNIGKSELWQAAFESERYVHGNPSGVDNSVAMYGGFILYNRREGVKRLEIRIPDDIKLIVIDSGISRSTRVAVEMFTSNLKRLGRLSRAILELADSITFEAIDCLKASDFECVGRLMYLSHGLLNGMGVSLPMLDELVTLVKRYGGLGAKLTGAGLGGVVIALAEAGKAERIAETITSLGFRVWTVTFQKWPSIFIAINTN